MRCFIAIDLAPQIKDQLAQAQQFFRTLPGKLTWTKREQMHLTIKFLGETADRLLPRVEEVLAGIAAGVGPFEFEVRGLGAFPPFGRQLRVLWAGISSPPELVRLRDACEREFKALGFEAEARPFAPHLTLARARLVERPESHRKVIAEHEDFVAGTQRADRIILFKSDLQPGGAVYTVLGEFPLGGG